MIVTPDVARSPSQCALHPEKHRYETPPAAYRAAASARRRTGEDITSYKCGRHWHIGHTPKGRR